MKKFLPGVFALSLIAASIWLLTPSCKTNLTCYAIIHVQDSTESPVAGAQVRLFCDESINPDCIVDVEKSTLSDGDAEFEFPLEAILKVEIDGADYGFIDLEPDETVEETYTVP